MKIIDIFKELTKIPRCSGTNEPFVKYIKQYASKYNFNVEVDEYHNILCYKNKRYTNLCLQSHYDIVCLKDSDISKTPEIIEKDGFLEAKNSTLGADNGIGCAYMLALMEEGYNLELLFTSDEEVGLIGASNITLDIQSTNMLNLDSEEEGIICIGCAGGIDIFASNNNSKYVQNSEDKSLYEIIIDNLDGGHSGVDIDKNIPNALKLITKSIKECDGELLDLSGGERINSIPKMAKAIIVSGTAPQPSHENMTITKMESTTEHYKQLDSNIIDFIYNFNNGIIEYNDKVGCVETSINLAIIVNSLDGIKIELSARSMDNEKLGTLKKEIINELKKYNFEVTTNGKYSAWKPEQNEFVDKVHTIYKQFNLDVKLEAIHAGLECAILKKKFSHIKPCSIGPNIYNPHSNKERCEIQSIDNIYKILKEICESESPLTV